MTTIETALRSYRYLLTHKHPDELKRLACVDAALDELTALQSALAQKEKDGERLDWLDHRTTFINLYHNPKGKPFVNFAGQGDSRGMPVLYPDIRAAIDAARSEGEGRT